MTGGPATDPIDIAPTHIGGAGRAWEIKLPPHPDNGTVAAWIVEAAWAHPAWHSYSVVLVHLRPLAHGRPPIVHLKGATHEMWVAALDPSHSRAPAIGGLEPAREMMPLNFAAQMIANSDAEAAARTFAAVAEICAGTLSPDTDFIRDWVKRFGDSMVRKA
jgi:hypothetical protein